MKIFSPVVFCLLLVCTACSQKSSFLESRARQQLPCSLEYDLNNFKNLEINDLKTVYCNDSICLLQFRLDFNDTLGTVYSRDMRYTYLIDFMMSHYKGKPVYKELMEFMSCMPDDYIKSNWKYVEDSGESVYSYMYGGTYPIPHPFDEQ